MHFTKLGWVRLILGIFLLLGIARFIYMLDHGGNHSSEWYAAGLMIFFFIGNIFWALAALRRPYFSAVAQIIFLAATYFGFNVAGGLIVVIVPLIVLSTIWCAADFLQFRNTDNASLNVLNVVTFVIGLIVIAYLTYLALWLSISGTSPVG